MTLAAPLPDLLAARRSGSERAKPLLTWYDDRTGERVELSAATLDNWATKVSALLVLELGVLPGDDVGVLLPAHWQTAAVLLGVVRAGARAVIGDAAARVVFAAADQLHAAADAEELVALAMRGLGGRVTDLPPGVLDFAVEVPPQPDVFAAPGGGEIAVAGVPVRPDGLALSSSDRVLSTLPWESAHALAVGFVAPLVAGASVVLAPYLAADAIEHRAAVERVTVVIDGTGGTGGELRRVAG